MQQQEDFRNYIGGFKELLELVVVDDILTEFYCKNYLNHLLQHKNYYMAIYADVLNKLARHSFKGKENISLIDYGSGNG